MMAISSCWTAHPTQICAAGLKHISIRPARTLRIWCAASTSHIIPMLIPLCTYSCSHLLSVCLRLRTSFRQLRHRPLRSLAFHLIHSAQCPLVSLSTPFLRPILERQRLSLYQDPLCLRGQMALRRRPRLHPICFALQFLLPHQEHSSIIFKLTNQCSRRRPFPMVP